MSADIYFRQIVASGNTGRLGNNDVATLTQGNIPVCYQARSFGGQYRIRYWIFYGYQAPCFGNLGWHHGDWEDVTVIVTTDGNSIAAVQFGQHGERYLRIAGPRDGRGPTFESWRMLVSLDGNGESWLARDRQANFAWGPDGVNTHPTIARFPTDSCTGDSLQPFDNAGCYKSECLSGDDQAIGSCIRECRPGYTNAGAMCARSRPPDGYSRLNASGKYGYAFPIPATDAGLSRRRQDAAEWALP
jgi:hypothetical protein